MKKKILEKFKELVENNYGTCLNSSTIEPSKDFRRERQRLYQQKKQGEKRKSKYYGVFFHRVSKTWVAHPKQVYLGYFKTEKLAWTKVRGWLRAHKPEIPEYTCKSCKNVWYPSFKIIKFCPKCRSNKIKKVFLNYE